MIPNGLLSVLAGESLLWFRNVPEEDLVSRMKNLPAGSTQISAWALETTFDLNASLFDPSAFIAERPRPERSVKRPMRSGGSLSLRSREMGSNLRERRESR